MMKITKHLKRENKESSYCVEHIQTNLRLAEGCNSMKHEEFDRVSGLSLLLEDKGVSEYIIPSRKGLIMNLY